MALRLKRRIGHYAFSLWLACSLAPSFASAADKPVPAKKAKKKPAAAEKKEAKPQTAKPAVAKPGAVEPAPKASAKPSAAPKTPTPSSAASVVSTQNKPTPTPSPSQAAAPASTLEPPPPPPENPANAAGDESIETTLAKELAETRSFRRDASREQAWKLWAKATRDPHSRAELERHARRMARLRQVLRLAKAEGKADAANRALSLIDFEQLRHERAMREGLPKKSSPGGSP